MKTTADHKQDKQGPARSSLDWALDKIWETTFDYLIKCPASDQISWKLSIFPQATDDIA